MNDDEFLAELRAFLQRREGRTRPLPALTPRNSRGSITQMVGVAAAVAFVVGGIIGGGIALRASRTGQTHTPPPAAAMSSPWAEGVPSPTAVANPSPTAVPVPVQSFVTKVAIDVPSLPLTFHVVQGTTLALHLHFTAGKPWEAWTVDVGAPYFGTQFAAVRVPYPGKHAAATPDDLYVGLRIPEVGFTIIDIEPPETCSGSPLAVGTVCGATALQIQVTAFAQLPPSAEVTGYLASPARCSGPGFLCLSHAPDGTTINFRNANGTVVSAVATYAGYSAELTPGTWHVSTTPAAVSLDEATLNVTAGEIVIDNAIVRSP